MARVSKDDWCTAALISLGRGGISQLKVETLARGLGVTKGSFYHHFKNRDALVSAALDLWQQRGTVAVIEAMNETADPRQRLADLLAESLSNLEHLRAEAGLMAAASEGHPLIAPVYHQVTQARLAYLVSVYSDIGVDHPERWAQVAFASYLGGVQLSAMQPSPLQQGDVPAYVAHLRTILTP